MLTTPQMTPKTPKSDKMNSDSKKDEQEHVSSKPSKKHNKDNKDQNSEHDVSDNASEQPEDIYLKITREHLNLLEVQKLLGYSTGPENKTDKEADITNVIQVPDQPQAQQQTIQQTVQKAQMVQQDQSQPVMVNPVVQIPANDGDPSGTGPSGFPDATTTAGDSCPCSSTTVSSASGSATATTSTEPEFHGQCSAILLPGGGSGHQGPKIWKYHVSYLIHIETNSYPLLKVMYYESNAT